jgi:uncharacterized membrane protein
VKPRMIIAFLALVGAFVALYLTLYKVGAIGNLSCSLGSCETVNLSEWSRFLGLPVALWGLVAYVLILALAVAGMQERLEASRAISWVLVGLSGWSMLFSAWLTYVEVAVIKAVCVWCVTSAVIVTLIFAASLADVRRHRASYPIDLP